LPAAVTAKGQEEAQTRKNLRTFSLYFKCALVLCAANRLSSPEMAYLEQNKRNIVGIGVMVNQLQ
jgi:hypothetical protein